MKNVFFCRAAGPLAAILAPPPEKDNPVAQHRSDVLRGFASAHGDGRHRDDHALTVNKERERGEKKELAKSCSTAPFHRPPQLPVKASQRLLVCLVESG